LTSHVLILRPEPGASATALRAKALGLDPISAPLFSVIPVAWTPPEGAFDAVVITSANAARLGGAELASWRHLPCYAVGEASAIAAREAGFADIRIGPSDGEALVGIMAAGGIATAVHPCGIDRIPLATSQVRVVDVPVYASESVAELPDVAVEAIAGGALVLLHSPRAASHFASLAGERGAIRIAVISPAAARAAGGGWSAIHVAERPRDEALLELAVKLCQTGGK